MENFVPFALCLLLFHQAVALRCRSGNQQVDAQFQKVLKTCRNRNAGLNIDNSEDSMSSKGSSSESDSSFEEHVYDKHFFYKKGDKSSYNQSMNNQRSRNFDRNGDMNAYSSNHSINGNIRDFQNIKNIHKSNDRGDFWNSRDSHNRKSDPNNSDMNNNGGGDARYNNNTSREQACIIQCFFNELNAVNQKGFPDRDLVIPLMSQNIQDPELKDFVEESIIECFQYLESNKREKCEYSQNLLTCLAEKGQQKCEDWEN